MGSRRRYGFGAVYPRRGRFVARLPNAWGRKSLGTYDTEEDAAAVLRAAAERLACVATVSAIGVSQRREYRNDGLGGDRP